MYSLSKTIYSLSKTIVYASKAIYLDKAAVAMIWVVSNTISSMFELFANLKIVVFARKGCMCLIIAGDEEEAGHRAAGVSGNRKCC